MNTLNNFLKATYTAIHTRSCTTNASSILGAGVQCERLISQVEWNSFLFVVYQMHWNHDNSTVKGRPGPQRLPVVPLGGLPLLCLQTSLSSPWQQRGWSTGLTSGRTSHTFVNYGCHFPLVQQYTQFFKVFNISKAKATSNSPKILCEIAAFFSEWQLSATLDERNKRTW